MEIQSLGDLFSAAASHRVFVDNTFGGEDVFDRVIVVAAIGHASDDCFVQYNSGSRDMTSDEQAS